MFCKFLLIRYFIFSYKNYQTISNYRFRLTSSSNKESYVVNLQRIPLFAKNSVKISKSLIMPSTCHEKLARGKCKRIKGDD